LRQRNQQGNGLLATQTGHPAAEIDGREAAIGGCGRAWLN